MTIILTSPSKSDNFPLAYISCPARLDFKRKEIVEFVAKHSRGPLHPFNALPYDQFEGGKLGRQITLKVCCKLVTVCDEFWMGGISEGVLIELTHFLKLNQKRSKAKPIILMVRQFDSEWRSFFEKFKDDKRFTKALSEIKPQLYNK